MLKKEKLNLNILISEVLKNYVDKQKNPQEVEIVYDFKQKEDNTIEADRERLAQVIHNLLDNALRFITHKSCQGEGVRQFVRKGRSHIAFGYRRLQNVHSLYPVVRQTGSKTSCNVGCYEVVRIF